MEFFHPTAVRIAGTLSKKGMAYFFEHTAGKWPDTRPDAYTDTFGKKPWEARGEGKMKEGDDADMWDFLAQENCVFLAKEDSRIYPTELGQAVLKVLETAGAFGNELGDEVIISNLLISLGYAEDQLKSIMKDSQIMDRLQGIIKVPGFSNFEKLRMVLEGPLADLLPIPEKIRV